MKQTFRMMCLLCVLLLGTAMSYAQTVTGVVKDKAGETIPGASVFIKGTTVGTTTDIEGKFTLAGVKNSSVLVFSFLGMKSQEVPVGSRSAFDITLESEANQLDEVVVTALGIKKDAKRLGYAVSRIDAEELLKTGNPNFATALYGKAAGVKIQAAPGGATSGVSINIRGMNSITNTSQPLVIVDGVPIRNGDANTTGYDANQRVQNNGLVDINPEDIAELSILKGASASALYGSEAANGVVMITTKSGKGKKGLGVDFSTTLSIDKVAFMPEFQTTFGTGTLWQERTPTWTSGFKEETFNGQKYERPEYETSQYFGPKYDGREVLFWDGTTRPYSPSGNGWNTMFRTGVSQMYNVAISQGAEKYNFRFSYTMQDNKNVQRESSNGRHNFSLTGSATLDKHFKIDYTASYMIQDITNRPYRLTRVLNSFKGMIGAFHDTQRMWDKTVTSMGYKFGVGNEKSATTDENLLFGLGDVAGGEKNFLMDQYYWNIRKRQNLEKNNRLIASVTPTIIFTDDLMLRTRIATDLTATKVENKNSTEQAAFINAKTGSYDLSNSRYEIIYGDALLMYNKTFAEDFNLTANFGYQARTEKYYQSTVGTNGGLAVDNWFNLSASNKTPTASMSETALLKQAWLGTVGISYKNYLFLETTLRQETSSTLRPDNNKFFYPSLNASFIFTDLLRENLPQWYNFGKIRASWGIVGNAPAIYKASRAYEQRTLSGFIYTQMPSSLNNDKLVPERKHEIEFGLESRFLGNRLGGEITFYTNTTKDQILETSAPMSSGGRSVWLNVGELQNTGWEFSVYGTPIRTKDWNWDVRANLSFNKNKVNSLMSGVDQLEHWDNKDQGAIRLISKVGEPIGDFYTYVPKTDANGNKIVAPNGLYDVDRTEMKKVGNAMPKAIGGFSTSLTYKNWFFDGSLDYRIGGDVLNTPYLYMMGRGSLKESMPNRDAANGGMSYYVKDGNKIAANSAPSGYILHDDGMILPGVKSDGTANDKIISSAYYYNQTYNWGNSGNIDYSRAIFSNSYVKVRELSIGYNLPSNIVSKLNLQGASFSIFGRNLFYIYRNMPALDAEATDGTSWQSQAEIGGSTATTRTFGASLRLKF